jgi:carbon monoxide dehydrogenase subunit G
MAVNHTDVDAPPAAVWRVLTKQVRDHDDSWPALGARLHHAIGCGPFVLRDCTSVEEVDAPSTLLLRAGMSILGASDVRFTLEPTGSGTRVTIDEHPVRGLIATLWNPAFEAMMRARNQELLRRLARVVEERVAEERART